MKNGFWVKSPCGAVRDENGISRGREDPEDEAEGASVHLTNGFAREKGQEKEAWTARKSKRELSRRRLHGLFFGTEII